jgi:hypothetical protein
VRTIFIFLAYMSLFFTANSVKVCLVGSWGDSSYVHTHFRCLRLTILNTKRIIEEGRCCMFVIVDKKYILTLVCIHCCSKYKHLREHAHISVHEACTMLLFYNFLSARTQIYNFITFKLRSTTEPIPALVSEQLYTRRR